MSKDYRIGRTAAPLGIDHLLQEARQAVAWGVPDNESIGLSPAKWANLVSRLIFVIEELQAKVTR